MTMKLASSPSRNSSITTSRPASPNWPANIACAAVRASSMEGAITTPLPAARPLALTTSGARWLRSHAASKLSRVKVAELAVGMRWRRRNSLAKALEPSSRAAARLGPKHLSARAANASTAPATSGASGPMMVRSTCSETASCTSPATSSAATFTLRTLASAAVPALPGATSTLVTRGEAAHFQASACSRPPPPTMRTFMAPREIEGGTTGSVDRSRLVPEVAYAGEHHGHAMLIGGRDELRIALAAARLDHGADAVAGGHVEVVAKRQERIRGHDRTGQRELLIGGLHRGEARGVHAAHLTCAHAEGDAGAREHDGVGFHELAHRPGESQVRELRIRRLAARGHGELARRQARQIARLRQQSCADAAQLEFAARELRPLPEHQHPYVGLAGQHARGRGVHGGCRQHLDELALEDRGRGGRVELAVEGDDAAVRGARIGAVGTPVGVEGRGRHGDPAGVGVLDDDAGGLRELAHALDGGIRVHYVVVRKVLALQHVRGANPCAAPGRLAVQRRALVRIFPVTQVLHLLEHERPGRGERLARGRLL